MSGLRTNVYVDGFNLFYGALKGRGLGRKWLDLDQLCRSILPDNDIQRIRYFTARVSARPDDVRLPERQHAYLRALLTIPHLTVHHGEFKVTYPRMPLYDPAAPAGLPPRKAQVIKTEEKGSDVNLASYLMLDACRRDCEVAVVITNDSDLRETDPARRSGTRCARRCHQPASTGETKPRDPVDVLPAAATEGRPGLPVS